MRCLAASAVASTNGLNDEPGCRSPCTARLNCDLRKLLPPTIASTRPSRGSRATSAADGAPVQFNHFAIASRAACCTLQVDRRAHAQPAAEDGGRAVAVDEQLLDVVREVRRLGLGPPGTRTSSGFGSGALFARTKSACVMWSCPTIASSTVRRRSRAARGCAPGSQRAGSAGMPASRAASGRLRVFALWPKYAFGRGLDAVGAVAEVDRVQVRGQDPRLRPVARAGLELPCERRLLQLPRDRALVVDERFLTNCCVIVEPPSTCSCSGRPPRRRA